MNNLKPNSGSKILVAFDKTPFDSLSDFTENTIYYDGWKQTIEAPDNYLSNVTEHATEVISNNIDDKSLIFEHNFIVRNFWMVYQNDNKPTVIIENDLNKLFLNLLQKNVAPVFNIAITNLLKRRDHLALQLDFEFGNLTEAEFGKREDEGRYLTEPQKIPIDLLEKNVKILFNFSNIFFDAEDISEMFDCTLEDAESVLSKLLTRE